MRITVDNLMHQLLNPQVNFEIARVVAERMGDCDTMGSAPLLWLTGPRHSSNSTQTALAHARAVCV